LELSPSPFDDSCILHAADNSQPAKISNINLTSLFFRGCLACIVAPCEGRSADILEPEVDKSMRTYVSKLELKEKGTVEFRLGYKKGAREAVERFELNTSIKLAHELGFKSRLVTSWPEP